MKERFTKNKRHKGLTLLLSAIWFAVIAPSLLRAQVGGEGAIQGRVVDPSGAVIPNATVTATNQATGVEQTRSATGAGDYFIGPLPAGIYTVEGKAKGFSAYVQKDVTVNATVSVGVDLHLQVGLATQSVTVSSAPPALDTTNATLSYTMDNEQYASLPLSMNGSQRDPTAFVYLMPGAQGGGRSGEFNGMGGNEGGQGVAETYIDGIPITQIDMQGDNRAVSLAISVDAVNQFQVVTNNAPVEFQGMGATNYVIKSGTNALHGTVSDYVRNTIFDSWYFFEHGAKQPTANGGTQLAPKPPEHQNELSMNLGGPILHNKLFYFGEYDKYRFTQLQPPGLLTVPTQAMRQGDFSADPFPIYDPTTTATCTAANAGVPCAYQFDGSLGGVPTPNVIPSSEISSISKNMQQYLPAPTNSNLVSNYLTNVSNGNNNWEITGRVDYKVSPKHTITLITNDGHRGFIGLDLGAAQVLPEPYENGVVVPEYTNSAIVQDTYTLTSHLVNQIKYGFVRFSGPVQNPTLGNSKYEANAGLGIGNLPQGQASDTFPGVNFSGGVDTPSRWYSPDGYSQYVNTYTLIDNVNWSRGAHNFTFGGQFQWLDQDESDFSTTSQALQMNMSSVSTAGFNSKGQIDSGTSGVAYASFLLGAVGGTGLIMQPFSTLGARFKAFSPYFEDDWRVNQNLTLNLGLRWDFYSPYHEVEDRWSFMNPDLINPATDSLGAIQFAGPGPDGCNCKTPVHYYLGNAAPRLGFSYSINPRTVVRGGFSINHSHSGGVGGAVGAGNGTGQTGFVAAPSFESSGQGETPAFYLNSSLPAPYGGTAFPGYSSTPNHGPTTNAGNYLTAANQTITPSGVAYAAPTVGGRAPYAENWNFGVERALTNSLTLEVNYVASESHFLPSNSLNGRGYYTNQLDPKYLVLGPLLGDLPGNIDASTGRTYLQDAQAILPGIGLPYANFGGADATIQAMLQPFPQYGGVTDTWGNISNANYNSLQISLSQRMWKGLTYSVNYTWSKEIDNAGAFRSGYAIPSSAIATGVAWKQDKIDRSLGAADTPQVLNFYGTYQLPFGQGKLGNGNKLVQWLAGNWSLSWIANDNSGTPLEITASNCTAPGQGTCFPNYNPSFTGKVRINGAWGHGVTSQNAGTIQFINPAAFTVPDSTTNYQIGDVSRTAPYNLFGPGFFNLNAGLSRKFVIAGKVNLVLGAEAFNVMNSVDWSGIGTNVSDANFGTVSSQSNAPRDWQLFGTVSF